jgi:hypothetical protein
VTVHSNPVGLPNDITATANATVDILYITYHDETAWGYLGGYAKPFTQLGFKNWGWTNGPLGQGTYTFDLIAGAGGNVLTDGKKVGTVTVDYGTVNANGGNVTVTYTVEDPDVLKDVHLYIGNNPLPTVKSGKKNVPTNSPGQFPYTGTVIDNGCIIAPTITFTGTIYVAAHAVVSIPNQ